MTKSEQAFLRYQIGEISLLEYYKVLDMEKMKFNSESNAKHVKDNNASVSNKSAADVASVDSSADITQKPETQDIADSVPGVKAGEKTAGDEKAAFKDRDTPLKGERQHHTVSINDKGAAQVDWDTTIDHVDVEAHGEKKMREWIDYKYAPLLEIEAKMSDWGMMHDINEKIAAKEPVKMAIQYRGKNLFGWVVAVGNDMIKFKPTPNTAKSYNIQSQEAVVKIDPSTLQWKTDKVGDPIVVGYGIDPTKSEFNPSLQDKEEPKKEVQGRETTPSSAYRYRHNPVTSPDNYDLIPKTPGPYTASTQGRETTTSNMYRNRGIQQASVEIKGLGLMEKIHSIRGRRYAIAQGTDGGPCELVADYYDEDGTAHTYYINGYSLPVDQETGVADFVVDRVEDEEGNEINDPAVLSWAEERLNMTPSVEDMDYEDECGMYHEDEEVDSSRLQRAVKHFSGSMSKMPSNPDNHGQAFMDAVEYFSKRGNTNNLTPDEKELAKVVLHYYTDDQTYQDEELMIAPNAKCGHCKALIAIDDDLGDFETTECPMCGSEEIVSELRGNYAKAANMKSKRNRVVDVGDGKDMDYVSDVVSRGMGATDYNYDAMRRDWYESFGCHGAICEHFQNARIAIGKEPLTGDDLNTMMSIVIEEYGSVDTYTLRDVVAYDEISNDNLIKVGTLQGVTYQSLAEVFGQANYDSETGVAGWDLRITYDDPETGNSGTGVVTIYQWLEDIQDSIENNKVWNVGSDEKKMFWVVREILRQ